VLYKNLTRCKKYWKVKSTRGKISAGRYEAGNVQEIVIPSEIDQNQFLCTFSVRVFFILLTISIHECFYTTHILLILKHFSLLSSDNLLPKLEAGSLFLIQKEI
jgi:hypothetical protein